MAHNIILSPSFRLYIHKGTDIENISPISYDSISHADFL